MVHPPFPMGSDVFGVYKREAGVANRYFSCGGG